MPPGLIGKSSRLLGKQLLPETCSRASMGHFMVCLFSPFLTKYHKQCALCFVASAGLAAFWGSMFCFELAALLTPLVHVFMFVTLPCVPQQKSSEGVAHLILDLQAYKSENKGKESGSHVFGHAKPFDQSKQCFGAPGSNQDPSRFRRNRTGEASTATT